MASRPCIGQPWMCLGHPTGPRFARPETSHVATSGDRRWVVTRYCTVELFVGAMRWTCIFSRSISLTTSGEMLLTQDRKSVEEGKSVSVRVDDGGRRLIKKTKRKCN